MDKTQAVENHIALIKKIAKTFPETTICNFNDYVSAGVLALLKSLETYDPDKGAFTTYIYRPVKWAMIKELEKDTRYTKQREKSNEVSVSHDDFPTKFYFPDNLTAVETRIINGKINGEKFSDMASELKVSKMTVYRAFVEAKRKIKEHIC